MFKILEAMGLHCTGCSACADICPNGALQVKGDYQLGYHAVIDQAKCIRCGKCEAVCPQISYQNGNFDKPNCYAVWANDRIRAHSTSGGIFTLLATQILNQGGVVCGAAYMDEYKVQHVIVTDESSLTKLCGSKYVQSDTTGVLSRIRSLLEDGVTVLFSGCPCQVAGLTSFLGKTYENLYTIDLLCAMTPSHALFHKYLDEKFGIDNITDFRFRVKDQGWVSDIHAVTLKSGKHSVYRTFNDSYHKGYHSHVHMRRVCEDCHFAGLPRVGDITIGDFWYVEKLDPSWNDYCGTSLVLTNNQRGHDLFDISIKDAQRVEQMPLQGLDFNRPPKLYAPASRDRFYDLLSRSTFKKAVEYALYEKYDVAIVGIWSERNYGSELTYYSLYHVLRQLGLETLMVERPRQVSWPPNELPVLFSTSPYKQYDLCPLHDTKKDMRELNRRCDTFIVGSDQIWHHDLYEVFGGFCYLDYIYDNKKKIAYASSFGRDYWSGGENDRKSVRHALTRFDAVSVRERSGERICKQQFGIEAKWVLDPVFLCPTDEYRRLAKASQLSVDERYIGAYLLDINKEKEDVLEHVASSLSLKLSVISDALKSKELKYGIDVNTNASMEDWLKNFIDCGFVITDSFHGTCLAILFNKPFIAIANKLRGVERFESLLNKLGLSHRLVFEPNEILSRSALLQNIDYSTVNRILDDEIAQSMNWLQSALSKKKTHDLTTNDILGDELAELNKQALSLKGAIANHDSALNRHEETLVHRGDELVQCKQIIDKNETVLGYHEAALVSNESTLASHDETISRVVPELVRHSELLVGNRKELDQLVSALNELRNSRSFWLGRAITYVPRKIAALFKRKRS